MPRNRPDYVAGLVNQPADGSVAKARPSDCPPGYSRSRSALGSPHAACRPQPPSPRVVKQRNVCPRSRCTASASAWLWLPTRTPARPDGCRSLPPTSFGCKTYGPWLGACAAASARDGSPFLARHSMFAALARPVLTAHPRKVFRPDALPIRDAPDRAHHRGLDPQRQEQVRTATVPPREEQHN